MRDEWSRAQPPPTPRTERSRHTVQPLHGTSDGLVSTVRRRSKTDKTQSAAVWASPTAPVNTAARLQAACIAEREPDVRGRL